MKNNGLKVSSVLISIKNKYFSIIAQETLRHVQLCYFTRCFNVVEKKKNVEPQNTRQEYQAGKSHDLSVKSTC